MSGRHLWPPPMKNPQTPRRYAATALPVVSPQRPPWREDRTALTVTPMLWHLKGGDTERVLTSPHFACADCGAEVRAKDYYIVQTPQALERHQGLGVCGECKELRVALWRLGGG